MLARIDRKTSKLKVILGIVVGNSLVGVGHISEILHEKYVACHLFWPKKD